MALKLLDKSGIARLLWRSVAGPASTKQAVEADAGSDISHPVPPVTGDARLWVAYCKDLETLHREADQIYGSFYVMEL